MNQLQKQVPQNKRSDFFMEAKKVYIVAAKRTPVGNFLGTLSGVKPKDMGATVVKALLEEIDAEKKK